MGKMENNSRDKEPPLDFEQAEEFEEFENAPYSLLDPLKCKETFLVHNKVISILDKTQNKFLLSYF